MARLLIIFTSWTILFASYFIDGASFQNKPNKSKENVTKSSALVCSESETEDNCPVDCPSDYCPKSRYEDQSACPIPAKCPPPACKCRFNYRRSANGSCIPTRECPPFPCDGPHEIYNPCPSYCPGENCSQATRDGACHLPGIFLPVVNCKPACRCDKTYWRLNGSCVPYEKCQKETTAVTIATTTSKSKTKTTARSSLTTSSTPPSPQCNDNEVVDDCPVDCPSDYCPESSEEDQSSCTKPEKCPPAACKCAFNHRRAENGTCIPTRSCPPFECIGENEVYDPCPSFCPGQSCSQATPDGKCRLFGYIRMVLSCEPACRCKMNYWRLNGTCVHYSQCPNQDGTINSTTMKSTTDSTTNCEETSTDITESITDSNYKESEITENNNECTSNDSNYGESEEYESGELKNNTDKSSSNSCNDKDDISNVSDCECNERDMNECECNRDSDCDCRNSKPTDSSNGDCNDKDDNPDESDCGCDERDINVCECSRDIDCGCKGSKATDSSNRDWNDKDDNSDESDCGCDERDINVCECSRDIDCGCKGSKPTDLSKGDSNDKDDNSDNGYNRDSDADTTKTCES